MARYSRNLFLFQIGQIPSSQWLWLSDAYRISNLQFLLLFAWKKYIEKPRAWFSFEILFYKNVWFSIILWKLEVFMGILNKKIWSKCILVQKHYFFFSENYSILLLQLCKQFVLLLWLTGYIHPHRVGKSMTSLVLQKYFKS